MITFCSQMCREEYAVFSGKKENEMENQLRANVNGFTEFPTPVLW